MNRIQSLITNLVQSAFIVNRVRVKSLIDFVLHLVEIEKKLLKESYVKNDIFPVKIFILYLYALCRMTLRFERRIRINHISFVVVKIRNKHFSIYFLYVYLFFPVSSRGSLWKYSRCRSREALFFYLVSSLCLRFPLRARHEWVRGTPFPSLTWPECLVQTPSQSFN